MGCSLHQHVTCPLAHIIRACMCTNGHPASLCKKHRVEHKMFEILKTLDCCVFKSWWAWVLVREVGLNFKTMLSLLWPLVAMKITVATGLVKSSAPVATVIRSTWQWLDVATGAVMALARCYCDICVEIWHLLIPFTKIDCQYNIHHRILPPPALACQWAHCVHMCKRTRNASERRTGWSKKLLDIFDRVILLWVYKMVDMKYSRWGETKVWVRLKWSLEAMGVVSQPPIATMIISSNGLGEVINAHCYCDRARLTVTERSNGRGDNNVLWPSSTSHRKIYDINNKMS
jgi:hypothetical protein